MQERSEKKVNLDEVIIYTDGACKGNPGPGGWGALLRFGDQTKEMAGGEPLTTNNRMEMTAALEALNALKRSCRVKLHTDSAYLMQAFTAGWIRNWQRNGWLTANKKPVENQDLWKALWTAAQRHQVEWIKVKGHAGVPDNERVDRLASDAADEVLQRLRNPVA